MAADKSKLNEGEKKVEELMNESLASIDEDFMDDLDHADIGEEEQISMFVRGITMVRCERYNANLTANGCQRKKEALPPRVKNAAAVDDENIQNHPCFGCLGPIMINWKEDRPAILLRRAERKSLISHPYFDNSLYRKEVLEEEELARRKAEARRLQLQREEELLQARAEVFDEDLDLEAEFEREMQADAERAESAAAPTPEPPSAPEPKAEPEPEPVAAKRSSRKTSRKKKQETAPPPVAKEEPQQLALALTEEPPAPKKKKKSSTKKSSEKVAKAETVSSPPAVEETASPDQHPPCADCGRAYEGKYVKHWRGDICNPCYAKRLRNKKKQQKDKQEKPKKDAASHPPCADCGRAYEGKYIKHWRGDICNPCYAKRLRNKKKQKK